MPSTNSQSMSRRTAGSWASEPIRVSGRASACRRYGDSIGCPVTLPTSARRCSASRRVNPMVTMSTGMPTHTVIRPVDTVVTVNRTSVPADSTTDSAAHQRACSRRVSALSTGSS